MAKLYGSTDWQVVRDEVMKEIQLEFKQDVPVKPTLEEGGQPGNPYRLGFGIHASRFVHLSISFEVQNIGFSKRLSYPRVLTYYAKFAQSVPHKIFVGEDGWRSESSTTSSQLENLSTNKALFRLCWDFAGGEYEGEGSTPLQKRFLSELLSGVTFGSAKLSNKVKVGKHLEIVPCESGSMIIANTAPTAEGGLLKVAEFINLADSIEQTLSD